MIKKIQNNAHVVQLNRDYFQGVTKTLGSINQILGFSFFTLLLSYLFFFFTNHADDYVQGLVKEFDLLTIARYLSIVSIIIIFLFIFPTTKFLLYKYQRKISILIPVSLLILLIAFSSTLCLVSIILKSEMGWFTKLGFEQLVLLYILTVASIFIVVTIYGVYRLKHKLTLGYSDSDTVINYNYKKPPSKGKYILFIGITSIIGGVTQSFQFVALVLVNTFLLIYSGKYIVELVYLAFLRNTDKYYQEDSIGKPNTIKIVVNLSTKFSTYTVLAGLFILVYTALGISYPQGADKFVTDESLFVTILVRASTLWLLIIAPSWWVLKKIFRAVFKKKDN